MTLGLANQRSQATLTGSLWNVVVRMRAPLAWAEKNWSRNDRGSSEPAVLEWQAGERLWERVGGQVGGETSGLLSTWTDRVTAVGWGVCPWCRLA